MKIKCDYCGATYEDTQAKCPQCGAPNPTQKGVTDKTPKTIVELKAWCIARHLPPEETTRFFIGKNIKEPRAFGIYQNESGDFVVYKNKDTGERAVRYKGKDEAYAVNELYQKLKEEIVHQKNASARRTSVNRSRVRFNKAGLIIFIIWLCVILVSGMIDQYRKRHNGYYNYNSAVYYNDADTWYYYDDYYDDWCLSTPPSEYDPEYTDPYYMGKTYSDASDWDYSERFSDIRDDEEYQDAHTSSSSSDSDYDWDSGSSWDSGGTDWSGDW